MARFERAILYFLRFAPLLRLTGRCASPRRCAFPVIPAEAGIQANTISRLLNDLFRSARPDLRPRQEAYPMHQGT